MNIVFEHRGEISYTARDPAGELIAWDGGSVALVRLMGEDSDRLINLAEQKTALVSSDMWEPCNVERWSISESVPAVCGMTAMEWCRRHIDAKYFIGHGGDRDWPRQWFDRLVKMGETEKHAALKLLKVKSFRSNFRRSLRDQLEAWLNDAAPRYGSPFSDRQWLALCDHYTRIDAKRTASSIYANR